MNFFCKYSKSLGELGKGIHSYRFMSIAILDLVGTIMFAFLFSYFLQIPFWVILGILLGLGILLHRLFCVRTTVDKLLFPTADNTR
jgi:hypothetical protein